MATDEGPRPNACKKGKGVKGPLGPDLSALLERLDFPVLEGSIATVPLICTTVPPIRRCIIPQGIVTFPCSSRGLRTLWLFHINCAFRLAINDSRLRFLCGLSISASGGACQCCATNRAGMSLMTVAGGGL